MLKIAICDGSRADVEILEAVFDSIRQYPLEYDVYLSAEELLKYHREHKESYHLYVFDIELLGMGGLELAREIRKDDAKALFVFLAGYAHHVMEVFNVTTFDCIAKPVTTEKWESVLLKAMHYLDMVKQDFVFRFRKNHFRVRCSDILYFEKNGRQAIIHTVAESHVANMTTEEIWKQLDEKVFAHIHVSYIVNLAHIKSIKGDEVLLDNGERFFIARSHRQELKEKHMDFIGR